MTAVLDSSAENARDEASATIGSTAASARCAECMSPFQRVQSAQLFCCREHKRAYNNRWLKRGAVIAPLYAAARMTRGGSRGDKITGARARGDAEHLVQRWNDEDRAAGRMAAVDYVAARYRFGLVEVAG